MSYHQLYMYCRLFDMFQQFPCMHLFVVYGDDSGGVVA